MTWWKCVARGVYINSANVTFLSPERYGDSPDFYWRIIAHGSGTNGEPLNGTYPTVEEAENAILKLLEGTIDPTVITGGS